MLAIVHTDTTATTIIFLTANISDNQKTLSQSV